MGNIQQNRAGVSAVEGRDVVLDAVEELLAAAVDADEAIRHALDAGCRVCVEQVTVVISSRLKRRPRQV